MNGHPSRARRLFRGPLGVLLCGWLLVIAAPTAAQQRFVFPGFVQWTQGSIMQVMGDNGYSIRVDLRQVEQSDYLTLRGGDRIRVFGYVSADRSRVIGERIERLEGNAYSSTTPFPQAP